MKDGFRYRLTESNSFTGGVNGGSNCFATSLYALDYLHWWSVHDASGVNFHNKQWLLNDTIFRNHDGGYQVNPMAYGIKAFDIGGHGRIEQVSILNPDSLDLTAYAVSEAGQTFVTIINKEHGSDARSADIKILGVTGARDADAMNLTAPDNNPFATEGITLGGTIIRNDSVWQPKWSYIQLDKNGECDLKIAASSAVIVRMR